MKDGKRIRKYVGGLPKFIGKVSLFAADCMKEFFNTAIELGTISRKTVVTNDDLTEYGEVAIDYFLEQDLALYDGLDDYCSNAFFFSLQLGIVLGCKARFEKLSHEYLRDVINNSPYEVGFVYLSLVGLDDTDNVFYQTILF